MSYRCLDKERKINIREDSIKTLQDIKNIIFDFDGVLVSTLGSYRQTTRKVVDYYFLNILNLEGEEGKLITLEDIQVFKDTGLYNDDWHLTHTFITYYLTLLMKKLEQLGLFEDFENRFHNLRFLDVESFLTTLREVGEFLRRQELNAVQLVDMKQSDETGINSLVEQVKSEKPVDLDTYLQSLLPQVGIRQLELIHKLIPYDQRGLALLKRLFEERYLGAELFEKFYGLSSIFNFQESYLEKETFIPTKKTLDRLYSRFGKFGIYSEKPKDQGMYLLEENNLTKYFDEERCIFREDLLNSKQEITQPGKPNPTLFIKMLEGLVGKTAYVGDTIADALLIEKTRLKGISRIAFFGMLSSSQSPDQLFIQFKNHIADAIMLNVNDIPRLYSKLGEFE